MQASQIPQLGIHYFPVNNIFTCEELANINLECETLAPTFCNEVHEIYYTGEKKLEFSLEHELKMPHLELPDVIHYLYVKLINRFANEIKLVGKHTISFLWLRLKPYSNRSCSQNWHFDKGTDKTMVVVLKNDFAYSKGVGLNIAVNKDQGVFSGSRFTDEQREVAPLDDQWISVPYEPGIIVVAEKGKIIHEMSHLAPQNFAPHGSKTRVIVQIKLMDSNWLP